jgi:hypothetical protein
VIRTWGSSCQLSSCTRLRLKDPALPDEFLTDAVAAIEQAQKSEGNLGADALADGNNAWWSVSSWQARGPMQALWTASRTGASRRGWTITATRRPSSTGSRTARICRTGRRGWRHITADGQVAELTQPSAANQTRDFPGRSRPPAAGGCRGTAARPAAMDQGEDCTHEIAGARAWPEHLRVGALRVVRWSARYDETVTFYRDVVGLPVLETFHASYGLDGTILGLPAARFTWRSCGCRMPGARRPGLISSCSTCPMWQRRRA